MRWIENTTDKRLMARHGGIDYVLPPGVTEFDLDHLADFVFHKFEPPRASGYDAGSNPLKRHVKKPSKEVAYQYHLLAPEPPKKAAPPPPPPPAPSGPLPTPGDKDAIPPIPGGAFDTKLNAGTKSQMTPTEKGLILRAAVAALDPEILVEEGKRLKVYKRGMEKGSLVDALIKAGFEPPAF